MCGRFTLRTPTRIIADIFSGISFPEIKPNYNVAPTHQVAALRRDGSDDKFAWLRWGLLPSWAKEKKIGARMINARCETIHEKPAYRAAFKRRRCLVLADGFYEWIPTPDGKQPMYITRKDDQPFAMAGLWEVNRKIETEAIESCTVVTTSANTLMAPIHERMPVILHRDSFDAWLDPQFENQKALQEMLVPCDPDWLSARPVSKNMNKVGYNAADCIEPVATQGDLFCFS